jgi:hypothetical protein
MAAVEGFERGYLGTLMRLTLLSPAMVEAILNWQLLDWVPVRLGGGRIPGRSSFSLGLR